MVLSAHRIEDLPDLSHDPRWLLAKRIVQSAIFRNSPRLSQLLPYLAEQTLLGRAELVTEQQIAKDVFGRGVDFDSAADTIVRSHMVRLRQKLDQYFADIEASAPLRATIPKGGYVLCFEAAQAASSLQAVSQAPSQDQLPATSLEQLANTAPPAGNPLIRRFSPIPLHSRILAIVLGAVLLMLAGAGLALVGSSFEAARFKAPPHPLWSLLFDSRKTTTFIAADSGLVLLHGMTRDETTLAQYLNRDFSQQTRRYPPGRTAEILDISSRRYTSFVDVEIVNRLGMLPDIHPELRPEARPDPLPEIRPSNGESRFIVKYARDARFEDFKEGNVILSGSRGANPWLELFEPRMNFVRVHDPAADRFVFNNRHPHPGESANYSASGSRVLGVLAFLPNLTGTGNALIIEGSSLAGTEAIADFLFNDRSLLPWCAGIRRSDGKLPHFELLLESDSVDGNAGPVRLLAERTYP